MIILTASCWKYCYHLSKTVENHIIKQEAWNGHASYLKIQMQTIVFLGCYNSLMILVVNILIKLFLVSFPATFRIVTQCSSPRQC